MILSVRVNNYLIYSDEVELSLFAEEKVHRFESNVGTEGGFKVLKSACVYGANNSGKTCLVRAIKYIKAVLLNDVAGLRYSTYYNQGISVNVGDFYNQYTGSRLSSFGISFVRGGRAFSYDFKYNADKSDDDGVKGFVYECLKELVTDENGEMTEKEIFVRDSVDKIYRFDGDEKLNRDLDSFYTSNILIYSASPEKYPAIVPYSKILKDFANSLEVVDTNNIPIDKTVRVLRDNEPIKDKVIDIIKKADLDIDDFFYAKAVIRNAAGEVVNENDYSKNGGTDQVTGLERLGLVSVHRGKGQPSLTFDSVGTCKIVALASYIVDALENGKTLVVDEFDSGLHFQITRDLVLLFNVNDNDKGGQLIFCTQDVTLLDCKRIFRQDQIWFVCKYKDEEFLYSLADLDYTDEDISSGFDFMERYMNGALSVIPKPNFWGLDIDEGEYVESVKRREKKDEN